MTANQIAAEEVRVKKRLAEETERHNAQVESISMVANDIQKQKVGNDYVIATERLLLDERIADANRRLQEAQGRRKLEIEAELASLEHEKVAIAERKQSLDESWKAMEQSYRTESLTELVRHNQRLEELQAKSNLIADYNAAANYDLGIMRNSIELSRVNLQSAEVQLQLQLGAQELRKKKFEADVQPIMTGINAANSLINSATSLIKSGKGGLNGKTTQTSQQQGASTIEQGKSEAYRRAESLFQ